MVDHEKRLNKILHDAWPDIDTHFVLEFRKLFGVVGGYINNKIFCSCGDFGFALKLPAEDVRSLLKEGAQPLKYFPNGHIKKDYAVLTDAMIDEHQLLNHHIKTSINFSTKPKGK
ncbi:MAG: TfoX/Sxy family protein [Betaproteobacteria bacterium]|nr:TfoX/Sxy family protein [Betaproteobacteria bacterium]